jgi:HEPN domain-containing protein
MQVSQWLKFARDDLIIARHACEDIHPKQIFIACYHCQQAAEKALKAYLIHKNAVFERTHDLVVLQGQCLDFDEGFDDLLPDCSTLTPYVTQARYPNAEEITEQETASALRKAEQIVTFCAGLISPE